MSTPQALWPSLDTAGLDSERVVAIRRKLQLQSPANLVEGKRNVPGSAPSIPSIMIRQPGADFISTTAKAEG
jgi:hypothetical protein